MAKTTIKGRALFEEIAGYSQPGDCLDAKRALELCSLLGRYSATMNTCNRVECNGAADWQDADWQRRTAARSGWQAVDEARNRAINCAKLTGNRYRKLASAAVNALCDVFPYITGADFHGDARGPAIVLQTEDGRGNYMGGGISVPC